MVTATNRGLQLGAAVTPEQHRLIRMAAGLSGTTVSNYIRTLSLEHARQDVDAYIEAETSKKSADGSGGQE